MFTILVTSDCIHNKLNMKKNKLKLIPSSQKKISSYFLKSPSKLEIKQNAALTVIQVESQKENNIFSKENINIENAKQQIIKKLNSNEEEIRNKSIVKNNIDNFTNDVTQLSKRHKLSSDFESGYDETFFSSDDSQNIKPTKINPNITNNKHSPNKNFIIDFQRKDDYLIDNTKYDNCRINPIIEDLENFDFAFFEDLDQEKDFYEDLCLEYWQKCEVIHVDNLNDMYKLTLTSISDKKRGSCYIKDFWKILTIKKGNIVSIIASKIQNEYYIDNNSGFLVLWPDNLISGTEIVGSLFCMRKSLLQNNFKGLDPNNKNMVIGTLVHELTQLSLTKALQNFEDIFLECEILLKKFDSISMMYGANMSYDDCISEMKNYIPHISDFIEKYVQPKNIKTAYKNKNHMCNKNKWNGYIDDIIDIEESIWSPKLGLSGRIDVTVQIHSPNSLKKSLLPLEIKTGRPTSSAEHRGQVILYTMLMSMFDNNDNKFNSDINAGLLLYLKEGVNIQHLTPGHSEKRDLFILRNRLAFYIKKWQSSFIINEYKNSEEKFNFELPEPINHHNACTKCPYLTLCSIYLSKNNYADIPDDHLLHTLKNEAIGHLNSNDINYFNHWCQLINIEESENNDNIKKSDIWNLSITEREKRGKCISNLMINDIIPKEDSFEHKFRSGSCKNSKNEFSILENFHQTSLKPGDYIVVSTQQRLAIAVGNITNISDSTINVLLNKNLNIRNTKYTLYTLDGYDSISMLTYNLTNLGLLMDNTDVSKKLRKIIIEKACVLQDEKLSKRIVDTGKDIFKNLNPDQLKTVLKALAAPDYILIKGMPGTGKTQTLVSLVRLFLKLNKTVIITSQTHSAIDTVFLRLKEFNIKMLRIGSQSRIHPELHSFSECALTQDCKNPEELEILYNSMNVIGVTCLGSHHPLLTKILFDVCIVDESTQVLQCTIIRPLLYAKKFILVGDPDQLPPIVRSDRARILGMDQSLFTLLDNHGATISLTIQYRMNKTIMELANRFTYNMQLKCANDTVANSTLNIQDFMDQNPVWLNTCLSSKLEDAVTIFDTGNTYLECNNRSNYIPENASDKKNLNICEAAIILHIVKALLKGGINENQIGIIAPYRDQVFFFKTIFNKYLNYSNTSDKCNSLSAKFPLIEINTVDQYQGKDKNIILYSCTKTLKEKKCNDIFTKENHLLEDKRRLTVAITRAKNKLIVIGDIESLQSYKPFHELFKCLSNNYKLGNRVSVSKMQNDNLFIWNDVFKIFKS